MNNLTVMKYDNNEIQNLKAYMKNKAIVFEWELLEAIDKIEMEWWLDLNASSIIKFYLNKAENAKKVNPRTWEMIDDEEVQMKAMDKILKILSWWLWWTKWNVVVNVQNNNIFWEMPEPWEVLLH